MHQLLAATSNSYSYEGERRNLEEKERFGESAVEPGARQPHLSSQVSIANRSSGANLFRHLAKWTWRWRRQWDYAHR